MSPSTTRLPAGTAGSGAAANLCRGIGERLYQAEVLTHLGQSHRAAGHHDAAREALRSALAILDELDHPSRADVRDAPRALRRPVSGAVPAADVASAGAG